MGKKRKEHAEEDESRAKRTKRPTPYGDSKDETAAPQDVNFQLDFYSADCFVDAPLMIAEEACVARGTFKDKQGREALVHVLTKSFFNLHTLDLNAPHIWSSLCMEGYFALPTWGLDLRRSWEALSTLSPNFRCRVTDFVGEEATIQLTRRLVREALNLQSYEVNFNVKGHKDKDWDQCFEAEEPRWD